MRHILPDEVCNLILSLTPPNPNGIGDRVVWKLSNDGEFTIGSAYSSLLHQVSNPYKQSYNAVWRWPGLERVRVQFWKMAR